MKTNILIALTLLSVNLSHSAWCAENISYSKVSWSGISAHVVSINLNSPDTKVSVTLAKNGRGSSESFSSMTNRVKPAAAITGTFFCTRSLLPTGDIVIDGKSIHTGSVGTGVCVTSDNKVKFIPYSIGHKTKWQGFEAVLCAGPTLLRGGQRFLIPRDEGFRDPSLFGHKRRTAVGLTNSNKLLMVTVEKPILLRTLANVMMHLGAVEAVSLDGGSSTALQINGKTVSRPGRSLTNLLVAYSTDYDYKQHRQALAPALRNTQVASANAPTSLTGMNAAYQIPENLTLSSRYRFTDLPSRGRIGLNAVRTPVTHSSSDASPAVGPIEAIITKSDTEASLTTLSTKPVRRDARQSEMNASNHSFAH